MAGWPCWNAAAKRFALGGSLLILAAAGGCASPYYRDQGALLGGLGGAGIGAAIGEHNDNPLAGAAIGAVAGTIAGAAVGDNIDQDIAVREAYAAQSGRQAGVAPQVVAGPPIVAGPTYVAAPPPVIIHDYYDPYCYGPPAPYWRHHHHHGYGPPGWRPRSGVSWGFSVSR